MTRIRRIAAAGLGACAAILVAAGPAGAVTWRQATTGTAEPITAIEYRSPAAAVVHDRRRQHLRASAQRRLRRPGLVPRAPVLRHRVPARAATSASRAPTAVSCSASPAAPGRPSASPTRRSTRTARTHQQPPYSRVTPTANIVAVAWSSDTVAWAATATRGPGAQERRRRRHLDRRQPPARRHLPRSRRRSATSRRSRAARATCTSSPPPAGSGGRSTASPSPAAFKLGDARAAALNGPIVRLAVDPLSANRVSAAGDCLLTWAFSGDAGGQQALPRRRQQRRTARHRRGAGRLPRRSATTACIQQTFDGTAFNTVTPRGSARQRAVVERGLRRA